MATSISDHLGVDPQLFALTGAFDAILDVDSLLFIDPHLLPDSKASEIACSYQRVLTHFRKILTVLSACHTVGDPFWREADRLFKFPELKGLCIGYSGKSTSGSGMGPGLRRQVLSTAKAIVDAGVANPELFELIGVFEEKIGPDRISDMVGKIIVKDLLAYTSRTLTELGAPVKLISYDNESYRSVTNPYNHSPVIMVPRDILRDLPVAKCWSDIDVVCAENLALRNRVNKIIGNTWRQATRQKKQTLKELLVAEPDVVRDLINLYKNKPALQYDFDNDPAGEVAWYKATRNYTRQFPLALCLGSMPSPEDVLAVVVKICNKFKI